MQPVTLKLTLLPFALCAQSAACTVLQRDKINALFFHTKRSHFLIIYTQFMITDRPAVHTMKIKI